MRRPVLMLALFLSLAAGAVAETGQTLERGRELTQRFYQERLDSLWEQFAPPMKEHFGDAEALRLFRDQIGAQLGQEASLLSEGVDAAGDSQVYKRTARFEKASGPVLVQWSLDKEGAVTGFLVTPAEAAPTQYLEYETKADLRLPFRGQWYVLWGGRTLSQNRHARVKDQRFAYDFVIREEGASHAGKGERNADYYCFGQPVLAPASGTVVAAVDGVEDNVPGNMNSRQPLGNYVIIDHGNDEFSFLAHLRRGSVEVEEGDQLEPGELLGDCGNSGHSSEPHLHYHLQTTSEPFKGEGLPAQFRHYAADGEPVARGEPVKGQVIRHSPPER
ncbi:M23 family metallopeptidase [Halomonadaceae bacterium KBTZ08]